MRSPSKREMGAAIILSLTSPFLGEGAAGCSSSLFVVEENVMFGVMFFMLLGCYQCFKCFFFVCVCEILCVVSL